MAPTLTDYHYLPEWRSEGFGGDRHESWHYRGIEIPGCATAALLVGHDVIVFERSESDLVSRGAGIGTPTAVWQDMMAHGLINETLPAFRIDYLRFVTPRIRDRPAAMAGRRPAIAELHVGQLGPSVSVASAGRP